MLDRGAMAQVEATTVQQKSEEVHAALQYAASLHSLVEEWQDCEELKYQAKRDVDLCKQENGSKKPPHGTVCGCKQLSLHEVWRNSKKMKMQGKCKGSRWLEKDSRLTIKRWSEAHLGGRAMVRSVDRNEEAFFCC